MAGLNLFTNNAATTLASGLLIGATSLTVAAGTGAEFPTLTGSEYFYCTIANNAGSVEIIKVTARSTDTFTIVRGQDGTSAAAWSSGDKVELRLTRIDLLNFPQLDSTNTFATTQTFTAAPVFTDQAGTRTAMSAAKSGANSDITSLTGLTTALSVAQGGTGQTTYTDGQLLIGNTTGNTLTKATLTAGTGISVTNGTGSITIANTVSGGFSNMDVITSTNATYSIPATKVKVTVVGGGGSGSATTGANTTGAGGGGGGAAIEIISGLTIGATVAVTIGAAGGTSSFGAYCSATGGANGATSASSSYWKLGGAGGAGSGGNINLTGGGGGNALFGSSTSLYSGDGGSSLLAGSRNTTTTRGAGNAGLAYGGGGSGAFADSSGTTYSGGTGASGIVIVEY